MTEEQRWKTEMGIEKNKVNELRVLNENFKTFIEILKQFRGTEDKSFKGDNINANDC